MTYSDSQEGDPEAPNIIVVDLPIENKKGLHARSSAKFVKQAEKFQSTITVSRMGKTVRATSIMGLLTLSAACGTRIKVSAFGPDATEAIEAITALVTRHFDEDE